MRYLLVLLILISYQDLHSQGLTYARNIVDTLAGPTMKGRGYVDNGVGLAAEYIAAEFDRLGVEKLSKNYFQTFEVPVNAFPGKMEMTVNGTKLIPGRDFLVEATSPGISGTYNVASLTHSDLLNRKVWIPKVRSATDKFLVIDSRDTVDRSTEEKKAINEIIGFLKYHPENPAKGTVIITNDKLTWGGATQVFTKPSFTIRSEAVKEEVTSIQLDVENHFYEAYEMNNVVGMIEGHNPDSVLVFSAHYDHIGMMGSSAIFPGANDNASGVAMLLNLAKYYSVNKPKHSIVFMAFAGEEIGLLGSTYYTENPLFPLSKIKFMMNFDLAGTGDDGIQIVNGSVFKDELDLMREINKS
ncbi:MAG: M28 family peptidase, partial [Bacteroidota bacterium]